MANSSLRKLSSHAAKAATTKLPHNFFFVLSLNVQRYRVQAAWSGLYSTVSRPFAKPESGKIAVKVINHYGDEVLKVFEME